MISVRKSVKGKLGLGFGSILVLVCLLGAFSFYTIERTSKVSDHMYTTNLTGLRAIANVNGRLTAMRGNILSVLMLGSPYAASKLSTQIGKMRQQIDKSWAAYYPELITTAGERQIAEKVLAQRDAVMRKLDKLMNMVEDYSFVQASGYYTAEVSGDFLALIGQLNKLADIQVAKAAQAHADGQATATRNKWIIIGAVAGVLLLTLLITFLLTRMITKPLGRARSLVDSIAQGRLDNNVDNPFKDEFGVMLGALKNMQDRLVAIVSKVRANSESVSVGAGEIASGNDELSSRTQEQAANLEETAASMEQMTSTVKQNADNAAQADQLARGVRTQASDSGAVVGRAVQAMDEINAASRKITDIVGLIDDIAFQTNLLALNASVEAARAGEQGRGFAVVASEVRNLASRSAAAAKDIRELVHDSAAKVEDGSQQVALSGKTLEEIVESINKVSDIVSEIAAASSEQSSGIDQVNLAVSQMDSMTQQNASLVEQSAAASRSLEEQAGALKRQVAFFQLAEGEGMAKAPLQPGVADGGDAAGDSGERPDAEPDATDSAFQAPPQRPTPAEPAWGKARAARINEEEEWATF